MASLGSAGRPLSDRCNGRNKIGEVINSAQTPTSRASRVRWRLCQSKFQGEFQMVTEMRQHSPARQQFGYFGVIAISLIVAAALCWGFAHV
jgi:hypothetical protein